MAERRLTRIQENGQVTLPADLRSKLGLKEGDLVAVIETAGGVLIASEEMVATSALDRIGEVLGEHGLSLDQLEQLIESGREERSALIEEQYGVRTVE